MRINVNYKKKVMKHKFMSQNLSLIQVITLTKRKILMLSWCIGSRCLWDVTTRSNVSRVFCQWEMIVHICTESEQLKTKWNPGKFWRKCSFSDFLAKIRVFWGWKKSLSSWNRYLDFISDWFIDSSRWTETSRYI